MGHHHLAAPRASLLLSELAEGRAPAFLEPRASPTACPRIFWTKSTISGTILTDPGQDIWWEDLGTQARPAPEAPAPRAPVPRPPTHHPHPCHLFNHLGTHSGRGSGSRERTLVTALGPRDRGHDSVRDTLSRSGLPCLCGTPSQNLGSSEKIGIVRHLTAVHGIQLGARKHIFCFFQQHPEGKEAGCAPASKP